MSGFVLSGIQGSVMHWNNRLSIILYIILFIAAINGTACAGPPAVDGLLPDFYLPLPGEIRYRQYLGLGEKPEFKVSEIKAEVIIIQIFSMY